MSIVASQLDGHLPSPILNEHHSSFPVKASPSTLATAVSIYAATDLPRSDSEVNGP